MPQLGWRCLAFGLVSSVGGLFYYWKRWCCCTSTGSVAAWRWHISGVYEALGEERWGVSCPGSRVSQRGRDWAAQKYVWLIDRKVTRRPAGVCRPGCESASVHERFSLRPGGVGL